MGVFVLIYLLVQLVVAAAIVSAYYKGMRALWRSSLPKFGKIFITLTTLPVLLIPFYLIAPGSAGSGDTIFLRGFLGLALQMHREWEFDITQNERVLFEIELDYNTGARGGAFVDQSLYYVKDGKKKEIDLRVHRGSAKDRFYKKPKSVFHIAKGDGPKNSYGLYNYDLYFSPELFTLDEFYRIAKFLRDHRKSIEKSINDYLQSRKPKVSHRVRFRDAYYQDIGSLARTFVCAGGLKLHLNPWGRLYYTTKDRYSTSFHDIAMVTDEGRKIKPDKNVKVVRDGQRYILRKRDTIITECRDAQSGEALFSMFSLER